MQDFKECRNHVLNLQDEKSFQQVRYETTRKEVLRIKDELQAEMKRNEEIQSETAGLVEGKIKSNSTQREHEMRLFEVRMALKRKTDDVETLKKQIADEESMFSKRYEVLCRDIEAKMAKGRDIDGPGEVLDTTVDECTKQESARLESTEPENVQTSFTASDANSISSDPTEMAEVEIDPKLREQYHFLIDKIHDTIQRTANSFRGLLEGFQDPSFQEKFPSLYEECMLQFVPALEHHLISLQYWLENLEGQPEEEQPNQNFDMSIHDMDQAVHCTSVETQ